jgi:DNA-binding transcriptional LysR family regulator
MIELRHLRYFVAVAEELHFRRAATRLRVAQPALSKQVCQLERLLGVVLLRRTNRRVELTSAGKLFLEEAKRTLAQAELAVATVQGAAEGEIGRLRIAYGATSELGLLPDVLPRFLRRYPRVAVDLQNLAPWEKLSAVNEGSGTVALLLLPPPRTEHLKIEALYAEPFIAALPAGSRLAACESISLADLSREPFVAFSRGVGPSVHDAVIAAFRGAGVSVSIAYEATHLYTNLGLVAAGLGVTLLPSAVANLERAGVVYRPLQAPVPTMELGMIWRADDMSPSLLRFIEVVREVVAERATGLVTASLHSAPEASDARERPVRGDGADGVRGDAPGP